MGAREGNKEKEQGKGTRGKNKGREHGEGARGGSKEREQDREQGRASVSVSQLSDQSASRSAGAE